MPERSVASSRFTNQPAFGIASACKLNLFLQKLTVGISMRFRELGTLNAPRSFLFPRGFRI